MNNLFSYIIPHRGKDGCRLSNLIAIINWIQQFAEHNIEIIVVEEDEKITFDLGENVKHILAYNTNVFSRSWGFNVGAKEAKGNYLIFGDADVFLKYDDFNNFLKKFSANQYDYDVISPYNNRVIFLNNDDSNIFRNSLQLNDNFIAPIGRSPLMGGVTVMKRKCYDRSNGWDENFSGWGGEDCAYESYLRALNVKIKYESYQAYHLYHERDKENKTEYRKKNKANKNYYLSVYHRKNKAHIESYRKINNDIGNVNKYR